MKKSLLVALLCLTVAIGALSGCTMAEEVLPSAAPTMDATASPNATATATATATAGTGTTMGN